MSSARGALTMPAGALVALVIALGVGMPVARAHDELVATTPLPDAAVATSPEAVTLEFSQAVLPLGAQVLVSAPGGAPVSRGPVEVRDGTVVQPVLADSPAGRYTVTWRVTSSDGHPLSGEFAFTVAEGAPIAAPDPSAASTGPGTDDADLSETAAQEALPSSSPVGPIAVGAALVVIAGGLVVLLRRRRT